FVIPNRTIAIGIFSLFACIAMIIGIIIVCLTLPKRQPTQCGLNLARISTNPIEYNYGPQHVAIGDFNEDTWMDFVIANWDVNLISIYFGFENGKFSKQNQYSTGVNSNPLMTAVSDLNNDLHLDIGVVNYG
ncbi:unnamed protein product, partial [Adineta ricciae]